MGLFWRFQQVGIARPAQMINAYSVSVWTKTHVTLVKGLEEVAQIAHVQLMDTTTELL